MHRRTRELLSLAGDEVSLSVLSKIAKTGSTEAQLRERCGIPHRTIHDRLARLRDVGVVSYVPGKSAGRGRPAGRWIYSGKEEMAKLKATAIEAEKRLQKSKSAV